MRKIVIATPSYDGTVHVDYFSSALALKTKLGENVEFLLLSNESLITRARNKLLSQYYHYFKDWDYLLFWDQDLYVDPNGILNMAESGLEVICAPYRIKNPNEFKLVYMDVLDDSKFPILEVRCAGTGCMMIRRDVVEKVVDFAKQNGLYYPDPGQYVRNTVDDQARDIYDVFQVGIDKGLNTYLSEDYWFCQLVRSLGYKVYLDLTVQTAHHGSVSYPYSAKLLLTEGRK